MVTNTKLVPFLNRATMLIMDETSQIWDMLSVLALLRMPNLERIAMFGGKAT